MMYEKDYFTNLVNLIKYTDVESIEDSIKKSKDVKNYLDTLSLDKRKIASGMDFLIWYFDVFSQESHFWNTNQAYYYAANTHEFGFLTANPQTSLMTLPAFNTGLVRLMNKKSQLTLLNNYQLNLFERIIKKDNEDWNYNTILMQDVELGTAGTYDFICMSIHDVLHDPELVVNFYNMLNKNGTMMMLYTGTDSLYKDESVFTDFYEVHENLKNIENSCVYHNPTGAAVTYAVKL
jgi:hypothetical protein